MKPDEIQSPQSCRYDPVLFIKKGDELKLSELDLIDLLQAVLNKGASFRFRAKGFSMSPFIKDDDIVTVSPHTDNSSMPGDVVAFIRPEMKKLVIHRVVGKEGEYFHIKGDNVPNTDELIPETNILGRVTMVERNGKEVLFGFGPERFLIAFLTRNGYLSTMLFYFSKIIRPFLKRIRF